MFFCFYFSFSSEWSLSTTSLGWLAMKAQEASSQCLGRSECYCFCLFVFLIWGHSKTQLKALQFAGYTWAFFPALRQPCVFEPNLHTIHFAIPLDNVIHTFSSLDMAVQVHFSLLLLSGEVIYQTLCHPTLPRAHPMLPLPSAPLGECKRMLLFSVYNPFNCW